MIMDVMWYQLPYNTLSDVGIDGIVVDVEGAISTVWYRMV